jgi:hypothetical protein
MSEHIFKPNHHKSSHWLWPSLLVSLITYWSMGAPLQALILE